MSTKDKTIKRIAFKSQRSLEGVTYINGKPHKSNKKDVKSSVDVMFAKIFAKDELGWPSSSLALYLGEKTSDDIKRFIEQNILVNNDSQHFVDNPQVVAEFQKLESSFVAESSRNVGESIENYEKRLQSIIERQDEESISAQAKRFRDKFFNQLKNA